jgi:hypothetical protein
MWSKYAFGWIVFVACCMILMSHPAKAADWTFSPYKAQISGASEDGSAATPDSAGSLPNQKKSIGKGVMFSLIIPGAGQLYSGTWWRAIPWFAIEVAGWAVFASYHNKGQNKTDEFEKYAGWRDTPNHFDYRAYMYAEYLVAKDSLRAREGNEYTRTFDEWINEPWDEREQHLPAPFTHDVKTDDSQQFYEMIGKYFSQFGWGWQDTHDGGNSQWTNPPDWTNPVAGLQADNTSTIAFDGGSTMFFYYRDLRAKANDLLDKGNVAMEVVLVNHILSALDAAIAVRSHNKKLAASQSLGDLRLRYDTKQFAGTTARYLTLSIPLD